MKYYSLNIFWLKFKFSAFLKSPNFDVVDLEGRVFAVPGRVPSLLAVVEVKGGLWGVVLPRLRGRGVDGLIGEVAEQGLNIL